MRRRARGQQAVVIIDEVDEAFVDALVIGDVCQWGMDARASLRRTRREPQSVSHQEPDAARHEPDLPNTLCPDDVTGPCAE